ncbi:MAG: hypothetical protein LBN34_08450 [Clostridiales Family XIII bacterium]|jgi:hypothetical protein|nr:hypothetical protein [Clostridiales Family XIII bacterium]
MEDRAKVIIPKNLNAPPEQHEIEVAWIFAFHYNCRVEFLKPNEGYKIKTADFIMNGMMWEIKSPKGNSREHTIKRQFRNAKGKNQYLIIDGRRTKLDDKFIIGRIRFELELHPSVRKLIFIAKDKKVLAMK